MFVLRNIHKLLQWRVNSCKLVQWRKLRLPDFAGWNSSLTDWALLDCVFDQKVRGIIFEAILSPSERNQNIQDNPENFCREYVDYFHY